MGNEEYKTNSNEIITLAEDLNGTFHVMCHWDDYGDDPGESRWHLTFKTEGEARKEFERWRK